MNCQQYCIIIHSIEHSFEISFLKNTCCGIPPEEADSFGQARLTQATAEPEGRAVSPFAARERLGPKSSLKRSNWSS